MSAELREKLAAWWYVQVASIVNFVPWIDLPQEKRAKYLTKVDKDLLPIIESERNTALAVRMLAIRAEFDLQGEELEKLMALSTSADQAALEAIKQQADEVSEQAAIEACIDIARSVKPEEIHGRLILYRDLIGRNARQEHDQQVPSPEEP